MLGLALARGAAWRVAVAGMFWFLSLFQLERFENMKSCENERGKSNRLFFLLLLA